MKSIPIAIFSWIFEALIKEGVKLCQNFYSLSYALILAHIAFALVYVVCSTIGSTTMARWMYPVHGENPRLLCFHPIRDPPE